MASAVVASPPPLLPTPTPPRRYASIPSQQQQQLQSAFEGDSAAAAVAAAAAAQAVGNCHASKAPSEQNTVLGGGGGVLAAVSSSRAADAVADGSRSNGNTLSPGTNVSQAGIQATEHFTVAREAVSESTSGSLPASSSDGGRSGKRSTTSVSSAPPVIDFAGVASGEPAARTRAVKQIRDAAREWGFFQIVNHGVSEDLVRALDRHAHEFFKLPKDVKMRGGNLPDPADGYKPVTAIARQWVEYLGFWYRPSPRVDAITEAIWPAGNPTLSKCLHDYGLAMERLDIQLLQLLAESLGLPSDTFAGHFADRQNSKTSLRMHWYPVCPEPERYMGAKPHSDSGLLTILKQDSVGGLQVLKDGAYVDVFHIPGAFIINLGDALEAWTNGIYRSVNHQVLANAKSERFSLVFQSYPGSDFVIECPPELDTEASPSLFVPFNGREQRQYFESKLQCKELPRAVSIEFALRLKREMTLLQ